MRANTLVACVAMLSLAACSSSNNTPTQAAAAPAPTAGSEAPAAPATPEPPPAPPPPAGRVRVIHAAPVTSPNVDISVDGNSALQDVAYKAVHGYMPLPAGEHAVALRAAGNASGDPLLSANVTVTADRFHTLIAHGTASGEPRLGVTALEDDRTAAPEGQARIRFFHALVGVAAVDLCVPGATARAAATPLFTNIAYGGTGAYANVPASAVTIQVRAQNARACTGNVIGTVAVTPSAGLLATAVAVGNVTASPAVAPELLVCNDAEQSSCAAVPVQLAPARSGARPAAPRR